MSILLKATLCPNSNLRRRPCRPSRLSTLTAFLRHPYIPKMTTAEEAAEILTNIIEDEDAAAALGIELVDEVLDHENVIELVVEVQKLQWCRYRRVRVRWIAH